MRVTLTLPLVALLLAGCGGGLPTLPRLADVPVAEDQGQAAALEGASEAPRTDIAQESPRTGLLGFFNRRASVAVETGPAQAPVDAAASDQQGDETRVDAVAGPVGPPVAAEGISDTQAVDVSPETVLSETAPAEPERGGLLGLFRRSGEDAASETIAPTVASAAIAETDRAAQEPQQDIAERATQVDATPRRGGLLGLFARSERDEDGEMQLAALPPQTQSDAAPRRRGRAVSADAPDYAQVGPGVTLPYGQIARLCGAPQRILGRQVDRAPARGRGFTLHDTAPGTSGAHTFFLTGFDDGCARQFTAALVLFSSPESYEQFRFGAPGKNMSKSKTDAAYDQIKSRVCRVPANKACGSQVSKLERNTVFVSVYERLGSNPKWKTILLHDGQVLAMDVKSN